MTHIVSKNGLLEPEVIIGFFAHFKGIHYKVFPFNHILITLLLTMEDRTRYLATGITFVKFRFARRLFRLGLTLGGLELYDCIGLAHQSWTFKQQETEFISIKTSANRFLSPSC